MKYWPQVNTLIGWNLTFEKDERGRSYYQLELFFDDVDYVRKYRYYCNPDGTGGVSWKVAEFLRAFSADHPLDTQAPFEPCQEDLRDMPVYICRIRYPSAKKDNGKIEYHDFDRFHFDPEVLSKDFEKAVKKGFVLDYHPELMSGSTRTRKAPPIGTTNDEAPF